MKSQVQFEEQARAKRLWDIVLGNRDPKEESEAPDDEDRARDSVPANSTRSSTATAVSLRDREDRKLEWSIFNTRLHLYEREAANLDKLKTWMQTTISADIYKHNCPPGESLSEWYENLQKNVGITDEEAYTIARTPISRPSSLQSFGKPQPGAEHGRMLSNTRTQ